MQTAAGALCFTVVGTEEWIQVRVTTVDKTGAPMPEPHDSISISHEECPRLSYDMEKGELHPRYGTPGNGLETDNPGWKREEPGESPDST